MPHHPLNLRPTPATPRNPPVETRGRGLRAALFLRVLLATVAPVAAAAAAPAVAQAEAAATAQLLADKLQVTNASRLIAEGHVEVSYDGSHLSAARVTYDRAQDRMVIDGPLVLTNADGSQQIMASQADLSANMTQGLLTAVRMVVDQRLTMTADQASRNGTGLTELTRVVASTCKVCAGQTPIWEIRARSLRHDQNARRVTFDHAVLRLAGLPVFFLPRLTLPDPSVKRATGVLIPSVSVSTTLGTVVRVPVFLTLGPSRDITLTPALGSGTNTLGFRYREAFDHGTIDITGAASQDDQRSFVRGYTKTTGSFDLADDFKLTFKLQTVSDAGYFLDYGLPEVDRLDSRVSIDRTRRMEYVGARVVTFNSLRDGDEGSIQPSVVGDATYDRRFALPAGQMANVRLDAHSQYRASNDALTDSNGDGIIDGRDQNHLTLTGDWQGTAILQNGMALTAMAEMQAASYWISQDATYGGQSARLTGTVATELRWPFARTSAAGTDVLEPVVQLMWSPDSLSQIPNEDSTLVEFDEGNLFSLSRFTGSDAYERGARVNLGGTWTHIAPSGLSYGLTLGRVLRADDLGQFSAASGLAGTRSDWLVALTLNTPSGDNLVARTLYDSDGSLTKAELRGSRTGDTYSLAGSYVWELADASEGRTTDASELRLDGGYDLTDQWRLNGATRYDFVADRPSLTALGLRFTNECVRLDLSLSRRYTSSTTVEPNTSFNLSVDLLGFGSGAATPATRACRG